MSTFGSASATRSGIGVHGWPNGRLKPGGTKWSRARPGRKTADVVAVDEEGVHPVRVAPHKNVAVAAQQPLESAEPGSVPRRAVPAPFRFVGLHPPAGAADRAVVLGDDDPRRARPQDGIQHPEVVPVDVDGQHVWSCRCVSLPEQLVHVLGSHHGGEAGDPPLAQRGRVLRLGRVALDPHGLPTAFDEGTGDVLFAVGRADLDGGARAHAEPPQHLVEDAVLAVLRELAPLEAGEVGCSPGNSAIPAPAVGPPEQGPGPLWAEAAAEQLRPDPSSHAAPDRNGAQRRFARPARSSSSGGIPPARGPRPPV